MRVRERDACVWDLKGTAPGCLGYLFLSKAMRCLEKEASYVLNATVRTWSVLYAPNGVWGSVNVRARLYL